MLTDRCLSILYLWALGSGELKMKSVRLQMLFIKEIHGYSTHRLKFHIKSSLRNFLMTNSPFLAFSDLLHSVEKIPSVQSLVATSRRPNIWGAVIALGFILISLWGAPQSVIDFIRTWIQQDLPAPLGPRVIMPWRTRWVSYSWIKRVRKDIFQQETINPYLGIQISLKWKEYTPQKLHFAEGITTCWVSAVKCIRIAPEKTL